MQGRTQKKRGILMKKCAICGNKVSVRNNGLSSLLDNEELKRMLDLKKEQTICHECKSTIMALDIFSPFYKKND